MYAFEGLAQVIYIALTFLGDGTGRPSLTVYYMEAQRPKEFQ